MMAYKDQDLMRNKLRSCKTEWSLHTSKINEIRKLTPSDRNRQVQHRTVQSWVPHYKKNIKLLKSTQRRTTNMVKGQERKICKE